MLVLLKDWRWTPTPGRINSQLSASFTRLMPRLDFKKTSDAMSAIIVADALRVVGKNLRGATYLNNAYLTCLKMDHNYGLINLIRARDRLKVHKVTPLVFASVIERFVQEYAAYPHVCGAVHLEQAYRLVRLGLTNEAQQALESAETTVKNIALGPYYAGWIDELKARLSSEKTWSAHPKNTKLDPSEISTLKEALLLLAAARNAYTQLGDREATKRILLRIKYEQNRIDKNLSRFHDSQPPGTTFAALSPSPTTELQIKPADAIASPTEVANGYKLKISRPSKTSIAVSAVLPDTKSRTKTVPRKEMTHLMSILVGPTNDPANNEFRKVFAERWLSVTHEMITVLATDKALWQRVTSQDQKPINLGLEITDSQLSGAPWEFMLMGDFTDSGLPKLSINCLYRTSTDNSRAQRKITSIQLALGKLYSEKSVVDGVFGPKTSRGIEQFQKDNDLQPTGIADYETIKRLGFVIARQFPRPVLIVQPSSEKQFHTAKGHVSSGVDLQAEYSNLGLASEVLEQPTLGSMARLLSEIRPQIIHLCPSIKSATNGIHLDFESKQPLPLSALAKILEQFNYQHKIRPLVILDVPRPSVFTEAVRQLILRNSLAALLMRMTNTAAILATGLGERFISQRLTNKSLLTSIAAGVSFAEMAANIRNTAREHPGKISAEERDNQRVFSQFIGPYGTALFTHDPSMVVL